MIRQDKQDGFVALLTCILLSMLLIVITMSLISIESVQLRKAEDSEQTLRAYYAAEAGIEDAVAKILNGTITSATPSACGPAPGYDTAGRADWTCQWVSFTGNPTGKLQKADEAVTVDTGATVGYRSIVVEWNQANNPSAAYYQPNLMGGAFPSAAAYNAVPPLELSILEYPTAGFSASQVCTSPGVPGGCVTSLKNMMFVPDGPATNGLTADYASALGHGPYRASCANLPRAIGFGSGGLYNCYAIIRFTVAEAARSHLIRLRTRYLPSAFRLTFMSNPAGNGSVVPVPEGMATIDVTAKAGDAYRRVVSKLPLNQSAAAGLNYVIYSDTDVCKNFDVFDNTLQGANPPNC